MNKCLLLILCLLPIQLFSQSADKTKTVKGQITEYFISTDKTFLVKGLVTDEKGKPLPQVRVMVKNSSVSSATDQEGKYTLTIGHADKTLIFYLPGKEWLEMPVTTDNLEINATMKPGTAQPAVTGKAASVTLWYDPEHDTAKTYCNPVNISYNFEYFNHSNNKSISCRSTADPMIVPYKGEYYLFSTNQSGYYVSKDMAQWHYIFSGFQRKPNDDDQCAPAVEVFGDTLIMIGSTYADLPVWYTTHPKDGRWKHLAESALLPHWDPDLFLDDDGRLYLYYGSSNEFPLKGVEYFRPTFRPKSIVYDLISLHPEQHGWERFGMNNDDSVTLRPFAEGSFMTKYQGKYYLQYGAPGTEFKIYADGVYVSDKPLGPFVYQKHNPFSYKPGGFVLGAGHGGTFKDYFGNYWHVATCMLSLRETFERRIGLYPAGFDKEGIMYTNTAFGDYPTFIPRTNGNHLKGNFTGWMLLSLHKRTWASSTDSIFVPKNASDENMRSYWAAKSNKPGEWFAMDLGTEGQVFAIQVNYYEHKANQYGRAMDLYHQYKIYSSMDGNHWDLAVDKSDNDQDVPHDYVELKKPLTTRYLKIENVHMPCGNFALMDFRVFGIKAGERPQSVKNLRIKRDKSDGRNAFISWKPKPTVYGYNLYYGTEPHKLYNCITIYDGNTYDMRGLDRGTVYYFSIEALSETGVSDKSEIVAAKK